MCYMAGPNYSSGMVLGLRKDSSPSTILLSNVAEVPRVGSTEQLAGECVGSVEFLSCLE